MLVIATPMRERGVPRSRTDIGRGNGARGNLFIEEAGDETLGRTLRVARLSGNAPLDKAPLLPLADATLLWMGTDGFVISGFETVDGAQYAQSWWCRKA